MHIREAVKEDIPAISSLDTKLSGKFVTPAFSKEGADKLIRSMNVNSIQRYVEKGYRYHVGTINNTIIGVVATKDNSHLYHLFVSENYQGNGYGRRLWDVAPNACILNASPAYFTVNSSLNAKLIYEKWGFVAISGIRESSGIRDIPMRLELSSVETTAR